MKGKLFIVSNRMPVTVEHSEGKAKVRQSSGGLVSAVSGYLDRDEGREFSRVYWAGIPDVPEKVWNGHIDDSEAAYEYLPVFVAKRLYDRYYNGFSNSVLWPLFHYFPSYAEYNEQHFEAYIKVNTLFEELLHARLRKEDTVWIHDYQLLPLAGMLREQFPELTIGFFLHIPFPSYELLRIIPRHWQKAILEGMLGADLIGFHTEDYAAHFIRSLEMILGLEADGQVLEFGKRKINIGVFPIGVDYEKYQQAGGSSGVLARQQYYRSIAGDRKIIFSVDRLDYTKGIGNRLKGYELFLKNNPGFQDKVVFLLVVVPSRDSIVRYAERKKMIDEFIGNFNSKHGYIGWQPIVYQYGHLSFEDLVALYTVCDLALITPLRDGMNLVAKEFVASRKDRRGVLVLSEMAGAAKELGAALLINPNDAGEMAVMIARALTMGHAEQESRMDTMQQVISTHDLYKWSSDFFSKLRSVKMVQMKFEHRFLDTMERIALLNACTAAQKRLFLLDYDGTLVPFCADPAEARPGEKLRSVLKALGADPRNTVYIISGRDRRFLDACFAGLQVHLIAEHGSLQKDPGGKWAGTTFAGHDWKKGICKIMDLYNAHCPGAFTEEKECSVAWHYRNAAPEAATKAETLMTELLLHKGTGNLEVMRGNKIVEVRMKGINKGKATKRVLENDVYDFILSVGDDVTDEDMFRELAQIPYAYSIKIGNEASFAKYNLYSTEMVNSLLESIANYAVATGKRQVVTGNKE